jgi:hypothetical protein
MRAMILAATLACAALGGCDQTPTATVAPAAPAAQAPVAAPVPAPVQSAAQTESPAIHRRHHHAWAHEEDSQSEYSESEVSTYGYISDSRNSYIGEEQSGYSDVSARPGGGLWVDGYGRGYFASGRALRAGTMRGKRLAPWKGYDEGCDR